MEENSSIIQVFYAGWEEYMTTLRDALARLTAEQLALRSAPTEWSVGEIAQHIIAGRLQWFHTFMGEGGDTVAHYAAWDKPDAPVRTADELARGLGESWQLMWDCLLKWTESDLKHTFPNEWEGTHYDTPRSWVVWHILEHDLIHTGEISLTLGMHGLEAPRP